MGLDPKKIADDFFELASEQRIRIMLHLLDEKSKLSQMAKKIESTTSEMHRNLNRLMTHGIILKDSQGYYSLSLFGKILCIQIPSLHFISSNKNFFTDHTIADLPTKFIQRLGVFQNSEHITGFVRVLEKWKKVYDNSQKYIYNILAEVPYSEDIIDIVSSKLQQGVKIHSIFSENSIIPNDRKILFEKKNFQKYIKDGALVRKMKKGISIVTLLNENEGCVIFPKLTGASDMSEMFYSNEPLFHDWCLDYFNECWNNSTAFTEKW